jgi:phthalate 4,5-dioxygenase oxygenase subunit
MMSREQNDRLTRIGQGTAAGTLMRMYWQPAALVEELPSERPMKPIRLLGQDLVLFRDRKGRYGLLDRDCPHRGADLAFGRLDDGGLRCAFHGWMFDVNGKCLETPAEPEGSTLCNHVRQKSYPAVERNGIVFAYLGDGAPPAFPDFDCFVAPATHVFAFKGLLECNWLQALEVGIDPAHASYLHRFFEDESPAENYGRQFRGASAGSDIPMTKVLREYTRPRIDVERTGYGMRLFALRRIDDAKTHVRVTNLVFPNAFVIPLSAEISITQWHVPIDDVSCYWYAIFTSFTGPVDAHEMREQRLQLYALPDYRPRFNKSNNYGFDVAEQLTQTYTGMGNDINVHDQWAVESQGPIQNRTREHLGQTDKGIALYRRILIEAIEQAGKGERPLMVLSPEQAARIRGPASVDCIGPTEGWQEYWQEIDARRRRLSSWGSELRHGDLDLRGAP